VGVIGLSGEDTPWVTMPRNVAGLAFTSAARAARREASRLRAAGAEVVVAVAHIGGRCGDLSDPDDLSSCEPGSSLFRLARALPPGTVDLLIGGHTHALVNHRVNGTALVQAGARADFLGWATLCAGEPARLHRPIRVARRTGEGPAVEPDARVAAAIAPFLAMARAERERPVGVRLEAPLTRDRRAASPFGTAAAASVREALKSDFGLMNAGALRVDPRVFFVGTTIAGAVWATIYFWLGFAVAAGYGQLEGAGLGPWPVGVGLGVIAVGFVVWRVVRARRPGGR